MLSYSIVFFGAGLGGAMRHGANVLALQHSGPGVGYGTVLVNILGSLLMGFVVAYLALIGESSQHLRLFLTWIIHEGDRRIRRAVGVAQALGRT